MENIGQRVEGQELNREGLVSEVRAFAEDPRRTEMELIERLFIRARHYGLEIKDSFVDLLKAMMSFRGTALSLDPQFQFILANVSCGTICDLQHEGSYEALDSQLERQFEKFRNVLVIKEERDLTEDEADIAIAKLKYPEVNQDRERDDMVQRLKELRGNIRRTAGVPGSINIFFGIPEGNTELFWAGEYYGAGHFNRAGTRMHVSLPFIDKRGEGAGIGVAEHELEHINNSRHKAISVDLRQALDEAIMRDRERKYNAII